MTRLQDLFIDLNDRALTSVRSGRGVHRSTLDLLVAEYPEVYERFASRIEPRGNGFHHLRGKRSQRLGSVGHREGKSAEHREWLRSAKRLCYGTPTCEVCSATSGPIFTKQTEDLVPWPRFCSFGCSKRGDAVLAKRRATCEVVYGVDNVSRAETVRSKLRDWWTEEDRRHRGECSKDFWSGLSDEARQALRDKKIATNQRMRGVDFPTQSRSVRKKCQATWMRTLGVSNPSKSPEVYDKIRNAFKSTKSVTHDGVAFTGLQGYEPQVLLDLLQVHGFNPDDIVNGKDIAHYEYSEGHKRRNYYPDFFVRKNGKDFVVEVKSTYTAGLHDGTFHSFANLRRKAAAVEASGDRFVLAIHHGGATHLYRGVPDRRVIRRQLLQR